MAPSNEAAPMISIGCSNFRILIRVDSASLAHETVGMTAGEQNIRVGEVDETLRFGSVTEKKGHAITYMIHKVLQDTCICGKVALICGQFLGCILGRVFDH